MSTGKKIALVVGGIYLFLIILTVGIFGWSRLDNEEFKPQNEFKLDPWISLKLGGLDLSITKAVFYVIVACVLTCVAMVYIANRMQARPNRIQTAVEVLFGLMRDNITRGNMDDKLAA